jgi:hypothetical protein
VRIMQRPMIERLMNMSNKSEGMGKENFVA